MSPAVDPPRVLVVGRGRAGGAFVRALSASGWDVESVSHRSLGGDHPPGPTGAHDLVLLCVPDAEVATCAARVAPGAGVVAHCAGSLGLDVLGDHPRVASLHPLVSLAEPDSGARLLRGAWFAVAGDPLITSVVDALGGTAVVVPDDERARYHAAAAVASNHLVALLWTVQKIASSTDVPLEAYLGLVRGTIDNVAGSGPRGALTGPVARGDWDTVRVHLENLEPAESAEYLAGVRTTAALARREVPPWLDSVAPWRPGTAAGH